MVTKETPWSINPKQPIPCAIPPSDATTRRRSLSTRDKVGQILTTGANNTDTEARRLPLGDIGDIKFSPSGTVHQLLLRLLRQVLRPMGTTLTPPTTVPIELSTSLTDTKFTRNIPTPFTICVYKLSSYVVEPVDGLVKLDDKSRASTTSVHEGSGKLSSETWSIRCPNNTT